MHTSIIPDRLARWSLREAVFYNEIKALDTFPASSIMDWYE